MLGAAVANLALRGESTAGVAQIADGAAFGNAAFGLAFGSLDRDPNAGAVYLSGADWTRNRSKR